MNMTTEESHQRKSPRIHLSKQKILYKFVDPKKNFVCNEVFKGYVLDLSEGGALLCGPLPSLRLMNLLGNEKIYIGCILLVSNYAIDEPQEAYIKMLSRIRWAQSDSQKGQSIHRMGLEFVKISETDSRLLKNYLIHKQIKTAKANRTTEMLNPEDYK